MPKIDAKILGLARRNRRAIYILARREDPSTRWEPYRRWDGGKPNILSSLDLLKVREARKEARKEAAVTGELTGLGAAAGYVARTAVRGLAAHGFFRRRRAD